MANLRIAALPLATSRQSLENARSHVELSEAMAPDGAARLRDLALPVRTASAPHAAQQREYMEVHHRGPASREQIDQLETRLANYGAMPRPQGAPAITGAEFAQQAIEGLMPQEVRQVYGAGVAASGELDRMAQRLGAAPRSRRA